MTDRPENRPENRPDDRPLTPAEEERVRRLLADARHTEPIPGDVVARLDAVLAGLAAEGAGSESTPAAAAPDSEGAPDAEAASTGPAVGDLAAARRRRRRFTQVLVAAAAVTVVGVAGPQLLGGAGDMMTAESGSTSAEDAGGADAAAESAAPPAAAEQDSSAAADPGGEEPRGLAAPKLTGDTLLSEVERLREAGPEPEATDRSESQATSALRACRDGAAWGPGRTVLVTFDGADAALVYRPVADGVQRVDLILCGDLTPTRTLTLPAP